MPPVPVSGNMLVPTTVDCDRLEGTVVAADVATDEPGVLVGVVVAVVVVVDVVVVGVVQPVPFSIHGPPTRPWGWLPKMNTNLMSTWPAKHGVVTDNVASGDLLMEVLQGVLANVLAGAIADHEELGGGCEAAAMPRQQRLCQDCSKRHGQFLPDGVLAFRRKGVCDPRDR